MTFTHPSGAYAVLSCVWSADPDFGMPEAGYLVLEYADKATYRQETENLFQSINFLCICPDHSGRYDFMIKVGELALLHAFFTEH